MATANEALVVVEEQLPTPSPNQHLMPVFSVKQAIERFQILTDYVKAIMNEGVDYGTIPGTNKPTLLKPGAEKLCTLFGLTARFYVAEKVVDWSGSEHDGEPFFYFAYRCALYSGERLIVEADGSCNSWESKYRWRKGERACPVCGAAAIIKGKAEYGGGWICFSKKGGCGGKFEDNDEAITSQVVGRVPNLDVADLVNTIQKMSQKRALIGAVLLGVNASEFFTQDTEDLPHLQEEATEPVRRQSATQSKGKVEPKRDPMAKTLADLVTPKQLVAMRGIAHAQGLKAEEECQRIYGCQLEELSRQTASAFIDDLKKRESEPEWSAGTRTDTLKATATPRLDPNLEKQARAMSEICRRGDGFWTIPNADSSEEDFTVEKSVDGRPICDCEDFMTGVERDENFQCVHIWAVKFAAAKSQSAT